MGSDDVFDRPAQWRLEAIRHLGLTGEARVAGAVTGAGYPQALDPIVAALRSCRCVCDVGAGLGGASAWLAANAGLEVIAVEPEWASARAARDLFPALPVVVGAADSLPLRATHVDGVTMLGVLSLIANDMEILAEALRVIRPGGVVGITDLWATSPGVGGDPASDNEFRTVEQLTATLRRVGADVLEVSAVALGSDQRWDRIGERVDDEIVAAHAGDDGFVAWRDDRKRLRTAIEAGELHAATVTARRR